MAGIYIHIPFCRQKCYYCDFYKTVNTTLVPVFLRALKTEISKTKNDLDNEPVETIYFGGGSPSVLSAAEIGDILHHIFAEFRVAADAEITLEANPDDLSTRYLNELRSQNINRLSIGIQSLDDNLLKKMNRRHHSGQAVEAVENAAKEGFNNISVDFIYGLPGLTSKVWKSGLNRILKLPVQHLSAYHLTYHEGTPFYTWLKKGTLKEAKETESVRQFEILVEEAQKNGFSHYEISNFAKVGFYSRHNSAYWKGVKYLGLGPSAHSFNGIARKWNVSHVESYIKAIENGLEYSEQEILTENNRYNEYILTRIRTIWGVSAYEIKQQFGEEKAAYFEKNIAKYIQAGQAVAENGIYFLTRKSWFISDEIIAQLMII